MLVVVSRLSAYLGRPARIDDLNESVLMGHLDWLTNKEKLSPRTVKGRRSTLLTIWKDAHKRKKTTENPREADVPKPTLLKHQPVAWSVEEMRVMLNQAAYARPRTHPWFGPQHWTALLQLIFHTGLRITAALSLKANDLQGELLRVPADIQKDREELLIPLPEHLVKLLRSLYRPDMVIHERQLNERLIPWPWSFHQPTDQFRKVILEPAGLTADDPRKKFHAIRRTTASILAAMHGREAARDALGHCNLEVTKGYVVPPEFVDPSLVDHRASPILSLPRIA